MALPNVSQLSGIDCTAFKLTADENNNLVIVLFSYHEGNVQNWNNDKYSFVQDQAFWRELLPADVLAYMFWRNGYFGAWLILAQSQRNFFGKGVIMVRNQKKVGGGHFVVKTKS